MKRMGIFFAAAMAAGMLWAAGPSITLHRVQQRYPWNGMVDIDYTVANVPAGSEARYYVRFTIPENGNTHVLHTMLDISTLIDASNGTYRVTWDSAGESDEYKFFATNVNVLAEIVYCGDDKSNVPYGEQYMIIDLTAGTTEAADVAKTYPVSYCYLPFDMATNRFNTTEYKTNKLVLRKVKAGTFIMGSPTTESGRSSNETQHQVTLTQDFVLGMFEVTQAQYCKVMGGTSASEYPQVYVSYATVRGSSNGCAVPPIFGNTDATSFMGLISRRTGMTFDLPTESQWEYACRAGTTGSIYAEPLDSIAWYRDNSGGGPHPVGQKIPNDWGFYDILGNAYEWCRDRGTSDWGSSAVVDPLGANGGSQISVRGGSGGTDDYANYSRAACRQSFANTSSSFVDCGFRLSRTLP